MVHAVQCTEDVKAYVGKTGDAIAGVTRLVTAECNCLFRCFGVEEFLDA